MIDQKDIDQSIAAAEEELIRLDTKRAECIQDGYGALETIALSCRVLLYQVVLSYLCRM